MQTTKAGAGRAGNINASTFGQVTSARDPRIGQIAIKANF
jgi:hypothetical protein